MMALKESLKALKSKVEEKEEAIKTEETVEEKKKGRAKKEEPAKPSFLAARQARQAEHLAAVRKKFGEGSLKLASNAEYQTIPRFSTGILALDWALGGGIPRGRMSVISGGWSSSKTRTALSLIADAQNRSVINGKYLWENMPEEERVPFNCAFVDAEGTFSPAWAQGCGVNLETLQLSRPLNQEEAAEIMVSAVSSGVYDLIVLDSLAQMMSADDVESAMDEKSYGTASAKKNNEMIKKMQAHLNKFNEGKVEGAQGVLPTVIIINQLRDKIGAFGFGPRKTRPGGVGQEYWSSVIIEMWGAKVEYFDTEKEFPKWGNFGFKIEKNKVSTPKIEGGFVMAIADDPEGTFKAGEFLEVKQVWDLCERFGIINKTENGKWDFKGEVFDTKKEAKDKYFKDKKIFSIIKRDILGILCPKQ